MLKNKCKSDEWIRNNKNAKSETDLLFFFYKRTQYKRKLKLKKEKNVMQKSMPVKIKR